MKGASVPAVGRSLERVEDRRLLSGRGRYVDDVQLPGGLHAAFLRSTVAHARIARLELAAARALPGVVAVYSAEDLKSVVGPLRFETGLEGHRVPSVPVLSGETVRYVGDPLVLAVAESRSVAEDALALIEVEYDELPAVLDLDGALAADAPVLFPEIGTNVMYRAVDSYGDLEQAWAQAEHIVEATIARNRVTSSALETRGILASFDPADGSLTCYASTKSPHMLRARVSEYAGIPSNRVRVLAGDVGGAFGGKGAIWREDLAIVGASKLLGRPVKWIEDRVENLTAFGAARDESFDVLAAVTADGTILGLSVRMRMDHGAYPGMWSTPMFASLVRCTLLNALRVRNFSFETTIIATNKSTYISYRGPGASETLVRERLLDVIARELDLDPVDVRRKNLLTLDEQPWRMPTGATVHRAHARETLESAVELVRYEELRHEQRRLRETGRLVGIGLATSIQPCPAFVDWWTSIGQVSEREPARVRLEPDGCLSVVTAEMPSGQGHETTLAQVAADELGAPFEHVRVVTGDTDVTPFYFFGSGASRASSMGTGAVRAATRSLKHRILRLASRMLEADVEDLEIADGIVAPRGASAGGLTLAAVARAAYGVRSDQSLAPEDVLDVTAYYEQETGCSGGWAASTHVCQIEIDPRTGFVEFQRYVVVEDCGPLINPAIVEGQIRGGIAQGIGATLLEHAVYDETGQFLSGTFTTYLLPTSMEIPEIEIKHLELPTDDEHGFRGVGESGMVMAPAALANAIEDALAPLEVSPGPFPLSPPAIVERIRSSRSQVAPIGATHGPDRAGG